LIDLADECAYNTADLDDGYSAGFFTLEEIAAAVPSYAGFLEEIRARFPGASETAHFQEVLRRLVNFLVSGLIEGTLEAVTESGIASVVDVREYPQRLVRMTAPAAATNRALKQFLTTRLYMTHDLLAEREQAAAGIARLFAFFLAHPNELPEGHRERLESLPLHRVVCDYIAGMTEGFFHRTGQRLFGAVPGTPPAN
jgi:dGTPase